MSADVESGKPEAIKRARAKSSVRSGPKDARRVMVLDGDTRAALAVTRSLGRAGMPVTVVASRRDAVAFASRYANEVLAAPSPYDYPVEFSEAVLERAQVGDVDVVVPCGWASIAALQRVRARLNRLAATATASVPILRRLSDRILVIETARDLGIPVPDYVLADDPLRPPVIPFAFPVYVRPRFSIVSGTGAARRARVTQARHWDELTYIVRTMPDAARPLIVQARLTGERESYYAVCRKGVPIMEMSQRSLRELPWLGGESVLREATPVDPVVAEYARRLLAALKFDGPVFMEFHRRRPGGEPCLLKVKPHFWRSLQLSVDAGVDFPRMAVDVALDRQPRQTAPVHFGVRSRWSLGDFEYLVMYGLRGKRVWHQAGRPPGRFEVLAQYLRDKHDPSTLNEVDIEEDSEPARLMRRRFRAKWLSTLRQAVFHPLGRDLRRFKGVVAYESPGAEWDRAAVRGVATVLQDARLQFVCLNWRNDGRSEKDFERFLRWCARESTDRFLIIPGVDYRSAEGERILAVGTRSLTPVAGAEKMARRIRELGGVSVWREPRFGDVASKAQIAEEVSGVEIWNPERHGSWAPSAVMAEELSAVMESAPYVGAFLLHPAVCLAKPPRAFIRVRARFLSETAVMAGLESGDFDLCGSLFNLRNDRVSYPLVRTYISWVNLVSGRLALSSREPAKEATP